MVDNYVHELDDSLSENNVIATGINNRDEVDLIHFKMIVPAKRNPGATSKITLVSLGSNGNSCVVFWKFKTKTQKYGTGETVSFTNPAPGTVIHVWCEMPTQSPAIAGWHVSCWYEEYFDFGRLGWVWLVLEYDRIAVTSIWAESNGAHSGRKETPIVARISANVIAVSMVGGIHMNVGDWVVIYDDNDVSKPFEFEADRGVVRRVHGSTPNTTIGEWGEYQNIEFADELPPWLNERDTFTDGLVREVDDQGLVSQFQSPLGSGHIGAKRFRIYPTWGVELPFRLLPEGIAVTKMSTGHFPLFDITRQAMVRTRYSEGLTHTSSIQDCDFPLGSDELPNDDPPHGPFTNDEDVVPSNPIDRIVVYDAPGFIARPEARPTFDRAERRGDFREFCRVRLDNIRPEGNNLDGSRCSGKVNWHVVVDVVPIRPENKFWRETVATEFPDRMENEVIVGTHLGEAKIKELEK